MDSQKQKNSLQTTFTIPRQVLFAEEDPMFFCGSCFSENMGSRLLELGFHTHINPGGIMYDPFSIQRCITQIADRKDSDESELYFFNGRFHSLQHHGSFSATDRNEILQIIRQRMMDAHTFLRKARLLIITPGTSFVYFHEPTGQYVANCHKIPQTEFSKRLLTQEEIVTALKRICETIAVINDKAKIQFTVSPVKHLRDGIAENSVSKARLISAVHQLVSEGQNGNLFYFPAYEIMTEELRDHRFYADDLAHPSAWSIRYIFERFIEAHASDSAQKYQQNAAAYLEMLKHRVMTNDPELIAAWELKKIRMFQEIKGKYPATLLKGPEN